jgi:hypothetical protein
MRKHQGQIPSRQKLLQQQQQHQQSPQQVQHRQTDEAISEDAVPGDLDAYFKRAGEIISRAMRARRRGR